jgi:hypothetical protein
MRRDGCQQKQATNRQPNFAQTAENINFVPSNLCSLGIAICIKVVYISHVMLPLMNMFFLFALLHPNAGVSILEVIKSYQSSLFPWN